jgi:glucose-6-phosphate isomerase
VGIGGSSLGPEMLVSALGDNKRDFTFINNIDPDQLALQLQKLDHTKSLFYIVSKSGGTAETSAAMAIVTSWLKEKGVEEKDLKNFMVFATDPVKSDLLTLGRAHDITCLEIPSNVGGRFSVLTPVGFLPALFAGIDCNQLLEGANEYKKTITNTNLEENILLKSASYLMGLKDDGFNQTVLMPYSSRLRDLSFWFVQLWAESLGKKHDNEGKTVNTGFTPIPAYGATDQHSQVQLFMEGPYDKTLMIIEVEKFQNDFSLASSFETSSFKKLANNSLSQLMKAELQGTLKALVDQDRPHMVLTMPEANAYYLGQLLFYLESLTTLTGVMLGINTFDQPGVEAGKRYAFEYLALL